MAIHVSKMLNFPYSKHEKKLQTNHLIILMHARNFICHNCRGTDSWELVSGLQGD